MAGIKVRHHIISRALYEGRHLCTVLVAWGYYSFGFKWFPLRWCWYTLGAVGINFYAIHKKLALLVLLVINIHYPIGHANFVTNLTLAKS